MTVRNGVISIPSLAPFLFPDYRLVSSLDAVVRSPLAMAFEEIGPLHEVQAHLSVYAKDAILWRSRPVLKMEYELTEPLKYVEVLCQTRGLPQAKRLERRVSYLSEDDLSMYIRSSSALGRWYTEIFEKGEKVYKLFEALLAGPKPFLSLYFEFRQSLSAAEILSSLLTFLERVLTYEDADKERLSDYYRTILLKARTHRRKILPAVLNLVRSNTEIPLDLRIISLCLTVRGGV